MVKKSDKPITLIVIFRNSGGELDRRVAVDGEDAVTKANTMISDAGCLEIGDVISVVAYPEV